MGSGRSNKLEERNGEVQKAVKDVPLKSLVRSGLPDERSKRHSPGPRLGILLWILTRVLRGRRRRARSTLVVPLLGDSVNRSATLVLGDARGAARVLVVLCKAHAELLSSGLDPCDESEPGRGNPSAVHAAGDGLPSGGGQAQLANVDEVRRALGEMGAMSGRGGRRGGRGDGGMGWLSRLLVWTRLLLRRELGGSKRETLLRLRLLRRLRIIVLWVRKRQSHGCVLCWTMAVKSVGRCG